MSYTYVQFQLSSCSCEDTKEERKKKTVDLYVYDITDKNGRKKVYISCGLWIAVLERIKGSLASMIPASLVSMIPTLLENIPTNLNQLSVSRKYKGW